MKLKTKLLAALGAAAMATAWGAIPASAAPLPPIDVRNHTVVCDSVIGTIKFSVPLVLGGTTSNTITIKGTVDGCDDLNDNNANPLTTVDILPSKISGTLTSATNDCQSLQGPSTTTSGSATTAWKTASKNLIGQKLPKITDGVNPDGKATSVLTVTQTNGATFQAPWYSAGPPELGAYGEFQVGTAFGTSAPGVANAFRGGFPGAPGSGAASQFRGTTGQSARALAFQCFSKGIKTINFGVGMVRLGS